ncbi:MAG: class I SAM-dependent methyltransferase [Nocardioidaceae bacterium]
MDDNLRVSRGRTFGDVADVYARARPTYPADAARWLVGDRPAKVLELGAGTGKLTASLVAQGHQVVATEPSGPMLAQLTGSLNVRAVRSGAEQLPFRAGTFDVVTVAQAFHWFDHERAVPEIARVLRHGGHLALVWNFRDEAIPWIRKLGQIIGSEPHGEDLNLSSGALATASLFEPVQTKHFGFWQQLDRQALLGMVESRSYIAALTPAERAEILSRVGDLYDGYERGHDGMRMRYVTECYRAQVRKDSSADVDIEPPGGGDLLFDFH